MDKLIKGTHHISIKPQNPEEFKETVNFYHRVLGMPIVRSWDTNGRIGAMLDTGNSLMEINCSGDGNRSEGSIRHFALATDDVDRAVQAVKNAGYTVTVEPKDSALPTFEPFPIRVAFCIGPCGELIEFFCEK